jgi:hypothetical protein
VCWRCIRHRVSHCRSARCSHSICSQRSACRRFVFSHNHHSHPTGIILNLFYNPKPARLIKAQPLTFIAAFDGLGSSPHRRGFRSHVALAKPRSAAGVLRPQRCRRMFEAIPALQVQIPRTFFSIVCSCSLVTLPFNPHTTDGTVSCTAPFSTWSPPSLAAPKCLRLPSKAAFCR